jgi:hypothetical protein
MSDRFEVGDRVFVKGQIGGIYEPQGTIIDFENPNPQPRVPFGGLTRSLKDGSFVAILLDNDIAKDFVYGPYFVVSTKAIVRLKKVGAGVANNSIKNCSPDLYCSCSTPNIVKRSTGMGFSSGSEYNFCKNCRKEKI